MKDQENLREMKRRKWEEEGMKSNFYKMVPE
jgi:hypothetical protein